MAEAVAIIAIFATLAYALLGGADFGGGVWDLFALGQRKDEQRAAIAHAMGPVWEANHVWLIFLIVILFTAFPPVYSTLSTALFIPFHLVLLGIVLRGAAFVFRAYGARAGTRITATERGWGVVFGISSVITPFLLGACMGAVASGAIRFVDGRAEMNGIAWLTPMSLLTGTIALALCAYLAAVYLTIETTGDLRRDFAGRAILAGTVTVALSVLALPLMRAQAPHLWRGLLSARALPILAVGVIAALLAGWSLLRGRYRLARAAAIVQIAMLLSGWFAAQYPYLVFPDLALENAAAPSASLRFFLIAIPIGFALLGPSLYLLFKVFKSESVSSE
ncbi:MAG TPA: cytochrome d ubiquinol oxidase subunit II [Longimicrobiales bacterium]